MARRKDRDLIEGPGLRIERIGRHIQVESARGPEEQRELQERLVEAREQIPRRVEQLAEELDAF